VVALDARSGRTVWRSTYDGSAHSYDSPAGIVVDPATGRIFVAGYSYVPFGSEAFALAIDADTGAIGWTAVFAGLGRDNTTRDLAVSSDGSVIYGVGATQDPEQHPWQVFTWAVATDVGEELWTSYWAAEDSAHAWAVAVPRGTHDVVVVGGAIYPAVIAYDEAGELRWSVVGSTPGDAPGVTSSPDGQTIYVSASEDNGPGDDFATHAYDSVTGSEESVARYNSASDGTDQDEPSQKHSIAVSGDGRHLVVTGDGRHPRDLENPADVLTVAYAT
jgi:DNA-binding beta-propeller fold protein YncE